MAAYALIEDEPESTYLNDGYSRSKSLHDILYHITLFLSILTITHVAFFYHIWWNLHSYEAHRLGMKAEWSIGLTSGDSPTTLQFSKNNQLSNLDVWEFPAEFVADPFYIKTPQALINKNPSLHPYYLFFEAKYVDYDGSSMFMRDLKTPGVAGKGVISVAWGDGLQEEEDGRLWRYEKTVIKESFHLSYPFIFEHQNETWMIPETGDNRDVRLYKSHDFPYDWQLEKVLLSGKAFRDCSPILHDGRWWLFIYESMENNFRIYYSDGTDIVTTKWTLHPKTPMYTNNDRYNRPGGRPLVHNGKIHRFVQDSSRRYGQKLVLMRVDILTTTEFIEVEVQTYAPDSRKTWMSKRLHHMDIQQGENGGWIGVVDGNDHYYSKGLLFWIGQGVILILYVAGVVGLIRIWRMYFHPAIIARSPSSPVLGAWMKYRMKAIATKGRIIYGSAVILQKTWIVILTLLVLAVVARCIFTLVLFKPVLVSKLSSQFNFEQEYKENNNSLILRSPIEPGECPVTVVMAFYDAGMTDQKTEKPRDIQKFASWVGINMKSFNSCIVMFTESPFMEYLIEQRLCSIEHKTGPGEYSLKGCLFPIEFNYVPLDRLREHKMFPMIKDAIAVFDPTHHRPTRVERIMPEYNLIQFHKTVLTVDVSRRNPFNSDYFFWADAAYGKGWWIHKKSFRKYRWPDVEKVKDMVDPKRVFLIAAHRPGGRLWDCHPVSVEEKAKQHVALMTGGFFGGTADSLAKYYPKWEKLLFDQLKEKIMDDDQFVLEEAMCAHPELVYLYPRLHLSTVMETVCTGTQVITRALMGFRRLGLCLTRSYSPIWIFHKDFHPPFA